MDKPISETFYEIAAMAARMGVTRVDEMDGCWEVDAGKWRLSVNGHSKTVKNSTGTDVPPMTAYVQYNGWPAGFIDPFGGVLAAGDAANETALIEALRAVPAARGED